ncbi:FAD-dependent oxidoreductase [Microbacterium sp. LWH7-1.2]|uniref:oxidoreductase n=1 Tax=Microbacterium sp. LWH7-1.2 TaxID=3135257 RepID=UPI003139D461
MTRDPRHDVLFEPVRIGPKTAPNRFYAVPHSAGMGSDKPLSQAAFRGMKAEGGWGVVCTEYAPVSPDADESPSASARIWDTDDGRALSLMVDAVHKNGSLAGIELTHLGGYAWRHESRWPAIAPSQFPSDFDILATAKAMEESDIRRVQDDWVRAARNARDVGFDIVYVYGGSDLTLQFLSSFYNHRTDRYGGSLENRARFWIETLEAVNGAVGSDCAIAVRLSMEALRGRGLSDDQILEFVSLADPLVDVWDVNMESTEDGTKDSGTSRFFKEGYQLEPTALMRQATRKPLVGVGRYTNPDTMASLVSSGRLDFIGGARPSIADPFLPSKISDGRYSEVRECIGCNVCVLKSETGRHLGCTQNATAGEEFRRGWHPERFDTSPREGTAALVVGAGPAGMECALTLAKRGFLVHLIDAADELGGHVRWVSQLPGLSEWGRLIEWRQLQLQNHPDVEVLLQRSMTADDVLAYGAEVVVLATGARWARDGMTGFNHTAIPGSDSPHVLTPEDIMVGGAKPEGRRVTVFDVEGYVVASGLAERLVREGYEVQIVTPFPQVAVVSDQTIEGPLVRQNLHKLGVTFLTGSVVTKIDTNEVSVTNEFGEERTMPCDTVVLVTRRVSEDRLYRELLERQGDWSEAEISAVHRIGDAVAPRLAADSIFDGQRLAREIDGPDPNVPLAYRRERVALPLLD